MASIGNQLSLNGLLMRAVKINVFFFHAYVFCCFFLHATHALASRRCSWRTADGGTRAKLSDRENNLLAFGWVWVQEKERRNHWSFYFLSYQSTWAKESKRTWEKRRRVTIATQVKNEITFLIIINFVLVMMRVCWVFSGFFCKIYCWKYNHAFIWDLDYFLLSWCIFISYNFTTLLHF